MKFADYAIAQELKDNLEKKGFKRPTDIQFKAIPSILEGEDVLAIAQTGTGKTAAFAIPLISKIHTYKFNSTRADGIKAIIMVPTHELAQQILSVINDFSRRTRVKAFAIIGGVDQSPQIAALDKGFDILIATPGRVFDLVHQGFLKLHRIDYLVLDEADHMLDRGFLKDIQDLIKHLPPKRQTLFFSATIDDEIKDLAYSLVTKPVRIQISPNDPVSKNIWHQRVAVAQDDKRFFLEKLVHEHEGKKILVFVRTKVRAERVLKALARVQIESISIHGDKTQEERSSAILAFRKGDVRIMIATDVSARGIDIPDVDIVINYDLPEYPENYVHRIGRTGRGVNKGYALSFVCHEELDYLNAIEEYIQKPISNIELGKAAYAETVQQNTAGDWKKLVELEETFRASTKKKNKRNTK